jgi:hypothetical protein
VQGESPAVVADAQFDVIGVALAGETQILP